MAGLLVWAETATCWGEIEVLRSASRRSASSLRLVSDACWRRAVLSEARCHPAAARPPINKTARMRAPVVMWSSGSARVGVIQELEIAILQDRFHGQVPPLDRAAVTQPDVPVNPATRVNDGRIPLVRRRRW